MPRATTPKVPAIETQALKAASKSEGMRMLFEDGYTVSQVKTVFNAPYGFVYGVALRAGYAETAAKRKGEGKAKTSRPTNTKKTTTPTAREAAKKPPKLVAKVVRHNRDETPVAKATAKAPTPGKVIVIPTAKVVKVASATTLPKATAAPKGTAVARVAAKLAAKKVAGRPTPERRAANRKPSASAQA